MFLYVPQARAGSERWDTTMGEVCKERNSKSWLSVIWRVCNAFMSLFFALASYVQVRVSLITCCYAFLWSPDPLPDMCSNFRSMIQTQDCGWWDDGNFSEYLSSCLCHSLFTPGFCYRLVIVFLQSCVQYWAGTRMWQVDRWVWTFLADVSSTWE